MKYSAELSRFLYFTSDLPSDPLLTKLQELADLPDGWRFGEGIPPRSTVIHIAQKIYQRLADFRLRADAFPGIDGSLTLVFYADERCVEIYISQDGRLDLSVEEGEGFDFREVKDISNASVSNAVEEVRLLAQKFNKWHLSGSSIHGNTIDMQSASAVHALLTPVTGQEYRLLRPNVFENTLRPSVNTSNTFIPVS